MLIIGETDDGRMWRIGDERFIDIGAVLSHLRDIGHSGAVLLSGTPDHDEFATLARVLSQAGYAVKFSASVVVMKCRCAEYTYAVVVETVYNRIFVHLWMLPVKVRRKVARRLTEKLTPAHVDDPCNWLAD